METIWNEFQHLLEDDKIDDLTRMYTLLSRIPRGLEPLRTTLEKHVQNVGLQAVQTNGSAAINVWTPYPSPSLANLSLRIPSYTWRHSSAYSRNTTTWSREHSALIPASSPRSTKPAAGSSMTTPSPPPRSHLRSPQSCLPDLLTCCSRRVPRIQKRERWSSFSTTWYVNSE